MHWSTLPERAPPVAAALVIALLGLLILAGTARALPTCESPGSVNVVNGTSGADTLRGTNRDDVLYGRGGDDVIYGSGGRDILCGEYGNDQLYGGSGGDVIYGGGDWDTLAGGLLDDHLFAGDGNDILIGGHGKDELQGENGDDWLRGGTNEDFYYGGSGGLDTASFATATPPGHEGRSGIRLASNTASCTELTALACRMTRLPRESTRQEAQTESLPAAHSGIPPGTPSRWTASRTSSGRRTTTTST